MSENHNGMDETHPTSPRTLATPTRFLVAARAPQRTSLTACPREADERDLPPPRPAACPAAAAAASAPPAACHYPPACRIRHPHRQPSGPAPSASELARERGADASRELANKTFADLDVGSEPTRPHLDRRRVPNSPA